MRLFHGVDMSDLGVLIVFILLCSATFLFLAGIEKLKEQK